MNSTLAVAVSSSRSAQRWAGRSPVSPSRASTCCGPDGSEQVRRTGCFVLAPYSNRIAAGRFDFDGSAHHLRRNSADHALPIHGVARKRVWQLDEQGADHLLLSLTHEPSQTRTPRTGRSPSTSASGCSCWTRVWHWSCGCTTATAGQCRRGLGWHPYFPRHAGVELQFAAEAVWLADEQQLPLRQTTIPASWDFSQLRAVNEPGLDNNFVGWNGQARLRWPAQRLSLAIEAGPWLQHPVVYTPSAARASSPWSRYPTPMARSVVAGKGWRSSHPGRP